jgi:hypothetical protein
MRFPAALFASCLSIVICTASLSRAQDDPKFSLTVYSTADPATFDPQELARQRLMNPHNHHHLRLPGYGVVRETRPIDLKAGENVVRFTDVAAGIDPTTVAFESLTAPDTTAVLEQNYEYDVVSAEKLLEKYLGKQVHVQVRPSGAVASPSTIAGTLLSADYQHVVLQSDSGEVRAIARQEVGMITLAAHDTALVTKPTLVWKLSADKAGKHDAQVTYQTDGLTWRADYNLVVSADDKSAHVGAWVTLLNESGASYPDAKLKLVAGDVQRVKPPQEAYQLSAYGGAGASSMDRRAGFVEKSFFEYHLYTLGRTTSLPDNSTKQIELFPTRSGVPITKKFVYYGLPPNVRYSFTPEPNLDQNLGTQSNKKVDIYLELKNSEANGMGMPLPAGRIRVYKTDDADDSLEFVGEDVIQHTPKDEEVMVRLGSAFDIIGERKQTDFKAEYDQRWITESFEIKLRNHKKESVQVVVKENLFRWANWELTHKSQDFEKQDHRTIHFTVDVPPGQEKVVTYTVRYTW